MDRYQRLTLLSSITELLLSDEKEQKKIKRLFPGRMKGKLRG